MSGLGKAIHGCIVWLQLEGGLTAGGPEALSGRGRSRVCPYEEACREHGSCLLPHHPRH